MITTPIQPANIDEYLKRLFPISRSITGNGNRETLRVLQELVPISIEEYPSQTKAYDWTIPGEWSIRSAWIKNSLGVKLVDWSECNLHVVGYSEPVHQFMKYEQLAENLHYLDHFPDAIPYRTTYYKKDWGFCVTRAQNSALLESKGELEIYIDSTIDDSGSMSIGEIIIPGKNRQEYLVSTYICHPSMANDNLSGVLATTYLAKLMIERGKPEYSWRFVFVPETIGAIAYLNQNEEIMKNLLGGFVISCCGGKGRLGYKESYVGNHLVDRAVQLAFRDQEIEPIRYPFTPDGSDERQYSSPGFRIPVTTITKDKYYEYPEYHTSMDNLDLVNGAQILEAMSVYQHAIEILDSNEQIKSKVPFGEPQLSSRGLYPTTGGAINQKSSSFRLDHKEVENIDLLAWLMFLADGDTDLISIAEQSGYRFRDLKEMVAVLRSQQLIETYQLLN